jgi:hypothetical protein
MSSEDGQFGLVNGFVSAREFNVEGDRFAYRPSTNS